MTTDPLFLPATPSLRRLACAYLTGDAPPHADWWAPWRGWTMPKCYTCGALGQYRPPVCLACGDTRTPWQIDALPLHIPAALAIARMRLAEVLRAPDLTDVQRVYVSGELVDIHYTDRTGNVRYTAPIARVAASALETREASALALALRHLDPEIHAAGGSDV